MDIEPLDLTVVDALSQELADPAVFARLVGLYLDRLGERLDAVINAEDPTSLAAAAHSLKSSSGTFGAIRLADLATRLEALGESGEEAPAQLLDELLTEAEAAGVALAAIAAAAQREAGGEPTEGADPPPA